MGIFKNYENTHGYKIINTVKPVTAANSHLAYKATLQSQSFRQLHRFYIYFYPLL